jgi:Zn-dependent peptidase ImmA (M78 family)
MRRDRARTAASDLLVKYGIQTAPVDVRAIAEGEGIIVITEPFEDEVSGVLVVDGQRATIGVNESHHPRRQRFTIAHELGHHQIHWMEKQAAAATEPTVFVDSSLTIYKKTLYKKAYFRKKPGATTVNAQEATLNSDVYNQEVEANAFAAELLMPQPILLAHLQKDIYDLHDERSVRKLASLFGVSEQALVIRLTVLGFVSG